MNPPNMTQHAFDRILDSTVTDPPALPQPTRSRQGFAVVSWRGITFTMDEAQADRLVALITDDVNQGQAVKVRADIEIQTTIDQPAQ